MYFYASNDDKNHPNKFTNNLTPLPNTRFPFTWPVFGSGGQRVEGLSAAVLPRDKDPFWDPVEPLLLGTAHLWLHSLAFRIPLEEQLEVRIQMHCKHTHTHTPSGGNVSEHGHIGLSSQVLGSEGTEEAILQAQLVPCTALGLYDTDTHTQNSIIVNTFAYI